MNTYDTRNIFKIQLNIIIRFFIVHLYYETNLLKRKKLFHSLHSNVFSYHLCNRIKPCDSVVLILTDNNNNNNNNNPLYSRFLLILLMVFCVLTFGVMAFGVMPIWRNVTRRERIKA